MIYNDEATKIDSRESYPIDESVAKMLGWMQGSIRLEKVTEDEYGPIYEHMAHLYSLFYPLETHLQFLLDRAKHHYGEVLRANEIAKVYVENTSPSDAASILMASDANLNMAYEQISYLNELTEKAQFYKLMIKQELAKNELSVLKIDQSITDKTGNLHITLNSLNDWAKQFEVNLIVDSKHLLEQSSLQNPPLKKRRYDSLSAELETILNRMHEPTPSKVMAELRSRAGSPTSCVTTNLGDGIQWERNNGNVETLNLDALEKRIKTWKTHRQAEDKRLGLG